MKDNYPTSPLATFPPPAPVRTPLRVRCGVTMRLHLSTHGVSPPAWPSPKGHIQPHRSHLPRRRNPRRVVLHDNEEVKVAEVVLEAQVVDVAPAQGEAEGKKASTEGTLVEDVKVVTKGHLEPHRNNLPRRRKVKRIILHDTDDDKVVAESSSSHAAPLAEVAATEPAPATDAFAPPPLADPSHLQEVLPWMCMAYAEDDALERLPGYTADAPYTHVVSIRYGTTPGVARSYESRCTYLRLTLAPRNPSTRRAGLGLSDAQLRAVRDFLAEIRPDLNVMDSAVRVLIATPPDHPTNAMCALACYVAFVTGKEVDAVLRAIDDEEGFLSTWKGEVSEDEVEKVEQIARAWSYMTQIVKPDIAT